MCSAIFILFSITHASDDLLLKVIAVEEIRLSFQWLWRWRKFVFRFSVELSIVSF